MKIGFPTNNNTLDALIEDRMSSATWLLIVETDDMSFEAMRAPEMASGSGAGIQGLTLLLESGAQMLMLGYIAPHIAQPLEKSGIRVVTDVSGRVEDLLQQYTERGTSKNSTPQKSVALPAFQKTMKQFSTMLPVLLGVVMVMGLLQAFLSKELILTVFSKNPLLDTIIGTFTGSLFAGNPINSYIIGESLLKVGAGWAGVSALMFSWVSIGLVQVPAEIHAMGLRFTTVRYGATFFITVAASLLTVFLMGAW